MTELGLELSLVSGEHRERLLSALANLIRKRGFEAFVSAPLVLPRSEYFPERWERSVKGARTLLRRLMHYAGLSHLKVRLASWQEGAVIPGHLTTRDDEGHHTAAWFAGIHDDTCEFGLELDQLRQEESLVATLGHEVAHAYREHHGLVIEDRDLEEKLTDLTCVYLGFGVFNLNASHVVETGGYSASGERLLYERRSLGYLSPGELALLLSAQLAARGDAAEQREVRKELQANHAALVAQGLREFADASEIRRQLGVPDPSTWSARVDLDELTALPEEDEPSEPANEPASDPVPERPSGPDGFVFRVTGDRRTSVTLLALAGSVTAGLAFELETLAFYGLCFAGGTAGALAGRRIPAHECSGCRGRLKLRAELCESCNAPIVGEIESHDDRLAAEERYQASNLPASINQRS